VQSTRGDLDGGLDHGDTPRDLEPRAPMTGPRGSVYGRRAAPDLAVLVRPAASSFLAAQRESCLLPPPVRRTFRGRLRRDGPSPAVPPLTLRSGPCPRDTPCALPRSRE